MNINNIFQTTAEQADFRGPDGLLHCGVCGEAKEAFFSDPIPGGPDRHPVHCRCRREAWEQREAESQARRHRETVRRLKAVISLQRCIRPAGLHGWSPAQNRFSHFMSAAARPILSAVSRMQHPCCGSRRSHPRWI